MREVTASGQTVEEAVQSALEQLDTTRDQVEIEIVDEGKKGLLGVFGSKPAIVKVNMPSDPVEQAEEYLKQIIEKMGIPVEVTTEVSGTQVNFNVTGDQIALIIGKRGQTLNAIQYMLHLVINKDRNHYYSVLVDAEGYRERRKETLESLARKMADKSLRLNKEVKLEPMPAFERKIIHHALQDNKQIATSSEGEEPHRYIVIKP
ncbi:protein jag [Lentibacillus cibarius]|uniref:RNA-binding protein KhpB n=1 Tax=Lentibacillus cibarius TaxID=2583219 RepID=A0A549YGP4_9BACI|nr:RNA-binding cell elongation regulator Jag/EloR [Lentibacillus cibarius]TRM11055.1 protein jag [Lentibacillus cibarius]